MGKIYSFSNRYTAPNIYNQRYVADISLTVYKKNLKKTDYKREDV